MVEHKNIVVSKRLVAVNSISSVVTKILNITILFWAYQYLLTRIPAEEFAVLPVVMAVMIFAPLFFTFLTSGISRYVIDSYARGDFEGVCRIISSIVPIVAGVALAFLGIGGIFVLNIENVLNIPPQMVASARIMMSLLMVSFALQMVFIPFQTGYQVRQRYVELNLYSILRDLLRLALLLSLLLIMGASVIWVVVATFVADTLFLTVTVTRSRRMVPELRFSRQRFHLGRARELMSFGGWTALGSLGDTMSIQGATLILNLFGTPIDVTSFYLGSTLYRQLNTAVTIGALPLQPALTAMHSLKDKARFGSTVLRGGRIGLWISLALAAPLGVFAEEFIDLYVGPTYMQATWVIEVFMASIPITYSTMLLAMTAMAMAAVRAFFLPAFLNQLAGLLLMLFLAAYLDAGAIGVALGLLIPVVVGQVFYFWPLCLKLTERSFPTFLRTVIVPGWTPALAGLFVLFPLKFAGFADSWVSLALCAAAGGVVYLAVLLLFCLETEDRRDLRSVIAWLGNGVIARRSAGRSSDDGSRPEAGARRQERT